MSELCYADLVPMSEITGVLEVLLADGFKSYIDFGKIVLIFCGLQHKIYDHSSLMDLLNTFLKVAEEAVNGFTKREKLIGQVILIELQNLSKEKFK